MKKIWILIFINWGFILYPISNIFAVTLESQNFKAGQKWVPYNKNIQAKRGEKVNHNKIAKKTVNNSSYSSYPIKDSIMKNSVDKISDSEWQKMESPFGGSVRRFDKFNDKIYAETDGDLFVYENDTWKSLNFYNYLFGYIYSLEVFENGRILIASDIGLFYSDNKGTSWQQITLDRWDVEVWNTFVASDGDVLLATSKGIYISKNNELNFTFLTLKDIGVSSINIDDKEYIWAVTDSCIYKANYKNLDWNKIKLDEPYLSKIIIDSNNVIYTHSDYNVFMSIDMGASWYTMQGPYIQDINLDNDGDLIITSANRIFFADRNGIKYASCVSEKILSTAYHLTGNEYFIGTIGNGVLKYNKYENKFSFLSTGINVTTVRDLVALDNGDIICCTDADSIYVSNDYGNSWKSVNQSWSRYMKKGSDNYIYAGANSGIVKSTDYGKTWTNLNLNVSPYFVNAIDICNGNKWILAGTSDGKIYFSDNFGNNFKLIKKDAEYFVDAVKILNEKTFLMKIDSLYFTNDCGKTFKAIGGSKFNNVTDFISDNKGNIYLSCFSGIFKSADGINWQNIYDKSGILYLRSDKNDNIYGAVPGGAVIVSNNYGRSWDKIAGDIPNHAFWSFTVSSDGYLFNGSQDKGLFRKKINIKKHEVDENKSSSFFIKLEQNYPNPFNVTTNISYAFSHDSNVELKIYDILGREIETLISVYKTAGVYFASWTPKNYASGMYFYRFKTDYGEKTSRMILLK